MAEQGKNPPDPRTIGALDAYRRVHQDKPESPIPQETDVAILRAQLQAERLKVADLDARLQKAEGVDGIIAFAGTTREEIAKMNSKERALLERRIRPVLFPGVGGNQEKRGKVLQEFHHLIDPNHTE